MGTHAQFIRVTAVSRTALGPRCQGCAKSIAKRMLTADGGSALQGLPRAAGDRDAPAIGREGRSGELMEPKSLLIRVILLSLCPKASTQNIPEYVAMRDCLRRGAELGWPPAVLLRTWVVLQGIRGKEGVDAAADAMGIGIPSWDSEAYWDTFCDRWEDRYRAAVKTQDAWPSWDTRRGWRQA